ncbi:outer membrane protein OmpW, partial [Escherichia sp. SS-MK2]
MKKLTVAALAVTTLLSGRTCTHKKFACFMRKGTA